MKKVFIIFFICISLCSVVHGTDISILNSQKESLEISDFISSKDGGNGAVREFIEWII